MLVVVSVGFGLGFGFTLQLQFFQPTLHFVAVNYEVNLRTCLHQAPQGPPWGAGLGKRHGLLAAMRSWNSSGSA